MTSPEARQSTVATDTTGTRFSRLLKAGIWASPLLLLITLFGWGLASPVGSSPDDDFHVASIWCAYGERAGLCETADEPDQRKVPIPIVNMTCFAFHPEIDGSCQKGQPEDPSAGVQPVNHGNWNGQTYPPLFYGTMGVFASENVAVSVVAIRLFNALLATVMLTLTMIALPRRLRPVLGVSATVALIPLGLFTLASTNPSSWALVSAAVVFPAVLGIAETQGRRRIALGALAIVGGVLGAGARADAAAYAAFAALLAWFLSAKKSRWNTIIALAICVIGAISFLTSGQADGLSGLSTEADAPTGGFNLLVFNLLALPSLWLGMFTNLGWLDTAMSSLAIFASVFATIAVLFAGINRISWRKALSLVAVCGMLVLLPLYVLHGSNAVVGSQLQPRYILPLLVILLAVAAAPFPTPLRLTLPQAWVLGALLAGGHALALYDTLTRYVAGQRVINLDAGDWWWGGSPVSPLGVLVAGSLAGAALIGLLLHWFMAQQRQQASYSVGATSTETVDAAGHSPS